MNLSRNPGSAPDNLCRSLIVDPKNPAISMFQCLQCVFIISRVSTLCQLGNLHVFLLCADFFSKSFFSKKSFRNTFRVSNILDSDQARRHVRPNLGPNCLQSLSVDNTSRQRVIQVSVFSIILLSPSSF